MYVCKSLNNLYIYVYIYIYICYINIYIYIHRRGHFSNAPALWLFNNTEPVEQHIFLQDSSHSNAVAVRRGTARCCRCAHWKGKNLQQAVASAKARCSRHQLHSAAPVWAVHADVGGFITPKSHSVFWYLWLELLGYIFFGLWLIYL